MIGCIYKRHLHALSLLAPALQFAHPDDGSGEVGRQSVWSIPEGRASVRDVVQEQATAVGKARLPHMLNLCGDVVDTLRGSAWCAPGHAKALSRIAP